MCWWYNWPLSALDIRHFIVNDNSFLENVAIDMGGCFAYTLNFKKSES